MLLAVRFQILLLQGSLLIEPRLSGSLGCRCIERLVRHQEMLEDSRASVLPVSILDLRQTRKGSRQGCKQWEGDVSGMAGGRRGGERVVSRMGARRYASVSPARRSRRSSG